MTFSVNSRDDDRDQGRRNRWLGILAVIAVPLAIGFAFIACQSILFGEFPQDFIIFYNSSQAWRHHGAVYDLASINMNPPTLTLAMAPLAWLPIASAANVWWGFSFVCLIVAMWIVQREVPNTNAWLLGSLIVISETGFSNIRLGQMAFPLLLVVTAAWAADRRESARSGGAWLGLALYMKPFLLIAVPYLAWRRSWRVLAHAGASVLALTLVGVAVGGFSIYAGWFRMLRNPPNTANQLNGSVFGLLSRALQSHPNYRTEPIAIWTRGQIITLWIVISLALLAVVAWRLRKNPDRDRAWALLLLWSILASPLGWVHYLCIVAGPLMATIRGWKAWACVWTAIYCLVLVRYMTLEQLTFNRRGTVVLASIYMWSTVLLFVAVLLSPSRTSTVSGSGDSL